MLTLYHTRNWHRSSTQGAYQVKKPYCSWSRKFSGKQEASGWFSFAATPFFSVFCLVIYIINPLQKLDTLGYTFGQSDFWPLCKRVKIVLVNQHSFRTINLGHQERSSRKKEGDNGATNERYIMGWLNLKNVSFWATNKWDRMGIIFFKRKKRKRGNKIGCTFRNGNQSNSRITDSQFFFSFLYG